eukprot:scaffold77828_cov53-Attheya_sp.AAC.2
MPNEVIDRVLTLARCSRNDNGLTFLDRDGNAFLDDQDDDSDQDEYVPDESDDYVEDELFSDDESDALIPGVPLAPDINIAGVTEDNNVENDVDNEDSTDDEGFDGNDVDENPVTKNADIEVPTNANNDDNDVDMRTLTWMRTLIIRHRLLMNPMVKLEMMKRKKCLYPVSGQDVKQIMTTSRSRENRRIIVIIGILAAIFMCRSRAHL